MAVQLRWVSRLAIDADASPDLYSRHSGFGGPTGEAVAASTPPAHRAVTPFSSAAEIQDRRFQPSM